jgi:hypothetical protein
MKANSDTCTDACAPPLLPAGFRNHFFDHQPCSNSSFSSAAWYLEISSNNGDQVLKRNSAS